MRITVKANELVDGEIDFVSLVKHGANRSPFKIIKMAEMDDDHSLTDSLKDKLNSMFGKSHAGVAAFFVKKGEEAQYVPLLKEAGFAWENAEELGTVTMYKQEGFDPEAEVSLVAIDCNFGMAFDQVVKEFSTYPMSDDFKENMGASAFFPGLHHSMEALGESIWNALNQAENLDSAAGVIDKNLKAFRTHVNALVKNMPASVIKIDLKGLANGIGGRNLTSETDGEVAKTGERKMKIAEAMAGDLAGLNDDIEKDEVALAKAEESVAEAAADAQIVYLDADGNEISEEEFEKMCGGKDKKDMKKGKMKKGDEEVDTLQIVKAEEGEEAAAEDDVEKGDVLGQGDSAFGDHSPGSGVVQSTSDSGAVSRDEGLPAGWRFMHSSVTKYDAEKGEMVTATAKFAVNDETKEQVFIEYVKEEEEEVQAAAPAGFEALAEPLNLIGKSIGKLADKMDAIDEKLQKQDEKIEQIGKSAEEAVEKAENTTLVDHGYDLDESFGLVNHTPVQKDVQGSTDIWKGLAPELDALEARFRGDQ